MSAEERACDLCGGRSVAPLYEVDGYPIVRCRGCGLVFVGSAPRPEDLIALYDEGYWEDAAAVGYGGYLAAETRKRRHYRGLLERIEAIAAPGTMLEVGCAYGYFLDEARRRGWRVRGLEPSPHAAAQARERFGLEVLSGPLAELPVEPGSCDAIALWDVIEHLPDPRETLERVHAWLREDGVLALSTGDFGSLAARLHGRDWSLMTPPWHQHYFSRGTMRRLLAATGFGLVSLGGEGLVAVDPASPRPRVPRPLARLLRHRLTVAVARRLGAGTIMFVFARKLGS